MAIASETFSFSTRLARVVQGKWFRRVSVQAMGMEVTALCHRSHWVPKSSRSSCSNCRRNVRLCKHHCRLCGEIVCGTCSTKRLVYQSKRVRTCDDCVNANVQSISEISRRQSTPSSTTISESRRICDAYERRSLQTVPQRSASSRGQRPPIRTSPKKPLVMATVSNINEKAEMSPSKNVVTLEDSSAASWQTQVTSIVAAVLVVLLSCALTQV